MSEMTETLHFFDLIVLSLTEREPMGQRRLVSAVNEWIDDNGIPTPAYTIRASTKNQIYDAIKRLETAGLVQAGEVREAYRITDRGVALLATLPGDWREWPVELPIRNGRAEWHRANYIAQFVIVRA